MEFLPTTSRLRCQSSLALGGMTQYVAILRTVFSVFLGVPPCRHRRTNSTPWSGNIRVIPHFTVPQNGEMIGISTVRFPFAMPILTSFGGMTYSILGAQPAENATMRMPLRASARRGCGPRSSDGLQYSHASAHPAAEAISDRGRSRRRSVKNRRPFDCFKSAAGIRFSAGAVADPEIVSPRRFLGYLLSAQKVAYEKIIEKMRLVRVARAAASRSGGPLLFANAHVAVSAGRGPNTDTSFCFVKYFAMRLDGIVKNSYIC